MLLNALIVIALSVAALAEAKLPSPPPEVAPQVVQEDRYPAHDVTFPNGGDPIFVYRCAECSMYSMVINGA